MTTFSKSEMQKASNNIRKSIKEQKGLPNTVKMKSREGKTYNLSKVHYLGLFQQKNIYIMRHNGKIPEYVTYNTKCGTLPIAMNYQNNDVNCCPTSLSMATMCLYDYVSEPKCAKVLGTGSGGTSPSQLVNNAGKLGYKVTRIGRNYKSVLKSLQKGKPVIAHIQTKPATCLGYLGDYGHYVLIYWCKKGEYYIADPTKGIHKCRDSILDKATNGRDIGYYRVEPK